MVYLPQTKNFVRRLFDGLAILCQGLVHGNKGDAMLPEWAKIKAGSSELTLLFVSWETVATLRKLRDKIPH